MSLLDRLDSAASARYKHAILAVLSKGSEAFVNQYNDQLYTHVEETEIPNATFRRRRGNSLA